MKGVESLPEDLEERLIEQNKRVVCIVKGKESAEIDKKMVVEALEELFLAVQPEYLEFAHDETPYLPSDYFDFYNKWFGHDVAEEPEGAGFDTLQNMLDFYEMHLSSEFRRAAKTSASALEKNGYSHGAVMVGSRFKRLFKERNLAIARYVHEAKEKNHSPREKRRHLNIIGRRFQFSMEETREFCERLPELIGKTNIGFHSVLFKEDAPAWDYQKFADFVADAEKMVQRLPPPVVPLLAKVKGEVFYRPSFLQNVERLAKEGKCADEKEIVEVASLDIPEYTFVRRLGEGADGVVYQAKHGMMGDVKIKLFKEPEDKIREAVEAEGVTLEERIRHRMENLDNVGDMTHIAKFKGVGRCKNPRNGEETVYLALEYIEAGAVETRRDGRYAIREDVAGDDILPIFLKFLKGLETIHNAGKVLKDVKLRNLLVSYDHKTVKIDDLETIAGIDEVRAGERLTQGSERYAAPEVLADIRNATAQSDLYSAGVCLLYMITKNPELMVEINSSAPAEYEKKLRQMLDRQELSPKQKRFFAKALAIEPEKRYKSSQEMASGLR